MNETPLWKRIHKDWYDKIVLANGLSFIGSIDESCQYGVTEKGKMLVKEGGGVYYARTDVDKI